MAFVAFKTKKDSYQAMDLVFRVMRELESNARHYSCLQGSFPGHETGIYEFPDLMLPVFSQNNIKFYRLSDEEADKYIPESSREFLRKNYENKE
jgi:hypothetical protein